VRDKVARREVVKRRGGISMSRWHDKRNILPGFLGLVCLTGSISGWWGTQGGRVDHHFPKLLNKIGIKIPVLGPDTEQII
jgi:hypothetical protein